MGILRKGKLEIRWGRAAKRGANVAKFGVFWGVGGANDARFFADDASDAHHFGEDKFLISLKRCVDVLENLLQKVLVWYWCLAAELT